MPGQIAPETEPSGSPLRLAYSPCPNDTFIFHAWTHGLVDGAPPVTEQLKDIDVLNQTALSGGADVIKVSVYAFAFLREDYALLHSGGAMGRGCGPLVVARKDSRFGAAPSVRRVAVLADELARARVAVPGELTTAALLVELLSGGLSRRVIMPFDRIMPAVAAEEVDAGVIIHEGRFTYGAYGLRRLVDLGEWWEDTSGSPIPLGGIAVRRSLGPARHQDIERAVRTSAERALANPEAAMAYVRKHSQELSPEVCRAHIDLYVNDFTLDYGAEGEAAIRGLLEAAGAVGAAPLSERGVFWDE